MTKDTLGIVSIVVSILAVGAVLIGSVTYAHSDLGDRIDNVRSDLSAQIGEMRGTVGELRERMARVETRLGSVETRLASIEGAVLADADANPKGAFPESPAL